MRSGWLKTPQPYFHIPCGGWFKKKSQKHDCKPVRYYETVAPSRPFDKPKKEWGIESTLEIMNMKGKKKKGKKGC